jgi:hypothetical protein
MERRGRPESEQHVVITDLFRSVWAVHLPIDHAFRPLSVMAEGWVARAEARLVLSTDHIAGVEIRLLGPLPSHRSTSPLCSDDVGTRSADRFVRSQCRLSVGIIRAAAAVSMIMPIGPVGPSATSSTRCPGWRARTVHRRPFDPHS